MQLVKTSSSRGSLSAAAGRFGLEVLFFGGIIPLGLVYTGVGIAWGTITLLSRPISSSSFAYGPWKDMASVWRLIGRHLRYLYRCDFLPWRKKRLAEKQRGARRQAAGAATKRQRREETRTLVLNPAYSSIDVEMFFALAFQFLPYLIFVPQAIVATIGLLSVWSFMPHYQGVVQYAPPIPAPTVVYEPQPADKQEADFGPWVNRAQIIGRAKSAGFVQIALLSDTGSVKYSRNKIGTLDGFAVSHSEKVANARLADGQILFEDERNNTFAVNPGQVFMFEGDDSEAFVFASDSRLMTIDPKNLKIKEN